MINYIYGPDMDQLNRRLNALNISKTQIISCSYDESRRYHFIYYFAND